MNTPKSCPCCRVIFFCLVNRCLHRFWICWSHLNQWKVNDTGFLPDRMALSMICSTAVSIVFSTFSFNRYTLKNWKSIIWALAQLTCRTQIRALLRLTSGTQGMRGFFGQNNELYWRIQLLWVIQWFLLYQTWNWHLWLVFPVFGKYCRQTNLFFWELISVPCLTVKTLNKRLFCGTSCKWLFFTNWTTGDFLNCQTSSYDEVTL